MQLNDDTFEIYAAKFYDIDSAIDEDEFIADLKRFQYLKRLFKRYKESDDLQVRLILNHLITIYNCFGIESTALLFYRLDEYWDYLNTFLIFLQYMPEKVIINDVVIESISLKIDEKIAKELRGI